MKTARKNRFRRNRKSNQIQLGGFESLEVRRVLSATPGFVHSVISETGDYSDGVHNAAKLTRAPMLSTVATGTLDVDDKDVFELQIRDDDILKIDVEHNRLADDVAMTLHRANGDVVAHDIDDTIVHRSDSNETLYLSVEAKTATAFTLNSRTIALLDVSELDRDWLFDFESELTEPLDGGLYAWLDDAGSVLSIGGPTGHGFQLASDWEVTIDADGDIVYRAQDRIGLQTQFLNFELPLPDFAVVEFATDSDAATSTFGEVVDHTFDLDLSFADIAGSMGSQLEEFELSDLSLPVDWGISLGGDALFANNDAPLNKTFPYLYVSGHSDSLQIGDLDISVVQAGFDVFFDPADPFVYVGVTPPSVGLSVGVAEEGIDSNDYALAASVQGLIPFTPVQQPNGWTSDHFYGHGYFKATASVPMVDAVQFTGAAFFELSGEGMKRVGVNGDIDISVDLFERDSKGKDDTEQNRDNSDSTTGTDSQTSNGTTSTENESKQEYQTDSNSDETRSKVLDMLFGDVSFPVGEATFVYDQGEVFYRGSTVNPLAGTPLGSFVDGTQMTIDGAHTTGGSFEISLLQRLRISGIDLQETEVTFSDEGVFLEGEIDLVIADAVLRGEVTADGFVLEGEGVLDVPGIGNVDAAFKLTEQGLTADFDADVLGSTVAFHANVGIAGVQLRGTANLKIGSMQLANAEIEINNGQIRIAAGSQLSDALEQNIAPKLQSWSDAAESQFGALNDALQSAQDRVNTLEVQLRAAEAEAAADAQGFVDALTAAENTLNAAISKHNANSSWTSREYRNWRNAISARKRASWYNYTYYKGREVYYYGRYQTAKAAKAVSGTALHVAKAAVSAVKEAAGWKAIGVLANPQVIALKATLVTANAALDTAQLAVSGVSAATTAALDATAWIASGNAFSVDQVTLEANVDDFFANPGNASLRVDIDFEFLGKEQNFDAGLRIADFSPTHLVDMVFDAVVPG